MSTTEQTTIKEKGFSEREKRLSEIERFADDDDSTTLGDRGWEFNEERILWGRPGDHYRTREGATMQQLQEDVWELLSIARQPLPFANWVPVATLPEKENYILLLDDSDHDYRCGSIFYEKPNELKGWTHWAYFPALSVPALSSISS